MDHSMVCYIERDIFAKIEDRKIIEHFQAMRTRRKQLPRGNATSSGTFSKSYSITL